MQVPSLAAATALALSGAAFAQTSGADHAAPHPAGASAPASTTPMADGEVRRVDKELDKLTLRHGPIASLDMSGMTMVFTVAAPKLLDTVKQGNRVKFPAVKVDRAITVTAIEVAT